MSKERGSVLPRPPPTKVNLPPSGKESRTKCPCAGTVGKLIR